MAAAGDETGEGRLHPQGVVSRDVTLEMVDRDERHVPRVGERLGCRETDEQRADQPRAHGRRYGGDVVPPAVGDAERLGDHSRQQLSVPARGDLGHDATELRVQLVLRRDDRGTHPSVLDDGGARVVARGLDAEDRAGDPGARGRHAESPSQSLHMITASSRSSV